MNTEKLKLFIQKYAMLPEGERVLCAVSGGADSVCLLHFLSTLDDISLVVAHYNHCLRGEESERDEAFVRKLCEDMGIMCVVERGNVASFAAEKGLGLEEAAREMRYAFLERAAREHSCGRIATAHNARDNVETIIMNLARGTGLKGLCGIPPVRGNIVRPLLETGREEIESYLSRNGLEHVEDSSNGLDDYSRNRVRHHVLPVLESINPSFDRAVASALDSLREDEAYLSGLAESFIGKHAEGNSLPVAPLLDLPESVRNRVIRRMHGGQLGSVHVKAIVNICLVRSVHAWTDVPGMRVERDRERLVFDVESPEGSCLPEYQLLPGQEIYIPEAGLRVSCREEANIKEIHKSLTTFVFKSANICGRMSLAPRREGAKIALEGRGCTKSLKKLFSEARLSLAQREKCPVIYDEEGPIAVAGFGIAARCAAKVGDDVILIEIKKEEDETNVQTHER